MFSPSIALLVNESSDDEDNDSSMNYRLERKLIRERYDIYNIPNKKFIESFRVTKDIFRYIHDEISPLFNETTSSTIPLKTLLAAVLNFYATGGYQRSIGDVLIHTMDQSVISRSISILTNTMERVLCANWIKFPNQQSQNNNKKLFFQKFKIPGIIGCIDCTHVYMIAPHENEHLFVNRKGRHSLNVQLICSLDLEIYSVNAKYPGSCHDAAIWSLCTERQALNQQFIDGQRNTRLLGDSGYPLENWLLTPFRSPTNDQKLFNRKHAQARNPIERCIGVLKGTFRCLLGERTLRYQPEKIIKIINVCCALHNIRLFHNLDVMEHFIDIPQNIEEEVQLDMDDENAALTRQNILNTFLTS